MCTCVIEADFVQTNKYNDFESVAVTAGNLWDCCHELSPPSFSLTLWKNSIITSQSESLIPAFSLLCMIVVILHSLTCFLLETLDVMFRIRDLLSIRLDLSVPQPVSIPLLHPHRSFADSHAQIAPKGSKNGTYGRLRVTTEFLLPMTFPILLLVQLVILVVVDVGFAVLCVLVCK